MNILQWSGVFSILGAIGVGLVLLISCAMYITIFQEKQAKYLWCGIMAGLQILVSFTSAKECGLTLAGKNFFIIAGSLIYPVLSCGEDYINEIYGKRVAQNALNAQIISRIVTTFYLILLIRIPAPLSNSENYTDFFKLMNTLPRIAISSISATYIAGFINIALYAKIKLFTNMRKLWLRSLISTITSSFMNAFLFSIFAFWGVKEISVIIQMVILSVVVRIFTGMVEVPFLYMMRLIHERFSQNSRLI